MTGHKPGKLSFRDFLTYVVSRDVNIIMLSKSQDNHSAVQNQKTVSAYFPSYNVRRPINKYSSETEKAN